MIFLREVFGIMSNPVNVELRELRMTKEHYLRILKEDKIIKDSGNVEGYMLLNDKDIEKINNKIDLITVKIGELLAEESDFVEVMDK